jgi:hypothetical protein
MEHGTTAFQPLFAKVSDVPGLPSTNIALSFNAITALFPGFNRLLVPSIDLLLILDFVSAAIDETLLPIAGQTVAGKELVNLTCSLRSGAKYEKPAKISKAKQSATTLIFNLTTFLLYEVMSFCLIPAP